MDFFRNGVGEQHVGSWSLDGRVFSYRVERADDFERRLVGEFMREQGIVASGFGQVAH